MAILCDKDTRLIVQGMGRMGRFHAKLSIDYGTRVVAGVGNIYANESLFDARIRPTSPIGSISRKRWGRLVSAIQQVLQDAIACGGSTISDFFGTDGNSGYFQINFKVYGRAGETCPRCPSTIKTIKLGGRASFYCPRCQR